jgi:hypothetical protein
MRRVIAAVCVLMLAAGLAGCAKKKYTITGTVTQGGEKLTWPNGGTLLVIYAPEDRKKDENVYRGDTDIATSTYRVEGIPPGRYTVAIQQFDTKHNDAFNKGYDLMRTNVVKEVTEDGQVIDIDLPKRKE